MPTFTIAEAEELVARALTRSRTSESNARSVARALVAAEADGLKGHGLSRTPMYAAQAKVKKIDGLAVPQVSAAAAGPDRDRCGPRLCVPGDRGGRKLLPDAARRQGIAAAAIRRSSHCGAAGQPVERLAAQGLVALMFVNTPGAMAPWGGIAAGVRHQSGGVRLPAARPRAAGDRPVAVQGGARQRRDGKAARRENPRRLGARCGGKPTTDPNAALAGTMVPMGDAKGMALALMVELFAAGLTGSNFAAEASSYLDAEGPPPGTGQFIIAFDPGAFGGDAVARFGALAASIEAQPGARLPGMRRLKLREQAKAEGLSICDALMKEIEAI